MNNLIKINLNYLKNSESFFYNQAISKQIKNLLKKEKLIVLKSIGTINKTSYINLNLNNLNNNIFYFNKNLDFQNLIKDKADLIKLIKEFTLLKNKPNIIVLEEVDCIKNIKSFIAEFYKAGYKLIIIDNNIKIPSKPEIEIKNPSYKQLKNKIENLSLNNLLLFGDNENIILLNNKALKINLLESQKNQILLNDLIKNYSIKNYNLLSYTITFLSFLNKKISLREIHRELKENIKISLVTLIEYIDFLVNSKLVKKIYSYDFKKQKTIKSKAFYYFSDLWIRNNLNYFSTKKSTAIKNLIFNELDKQWFKTKSGINWKFEFDFYAKKKEFLEEKNTKKINKLYIHLSEANDKKELKKEINKLNKVPYYPTLSKSGENIDETISRYLIVENIKEFWIKKLQYNEVKIIELEEFLINL